MNVGLVLSDGQVELRLADEADADLIVRLRNTAKASILPKGAQTVADQVVWLRQYKSREQAKFEYYFIIIFQGRSLGAVRVYNIDPINKNYSWGSWVVEEGTPMVVSLITVRLIYDFAFDRLGMKKALFDVRLRNSNVIRFHRQLGSAEICRDDVDVYFEFSIEQYRDSRRRLTRLIESS